MLHYLRETCFSNQQSLSLGNMGTLAFINYFKSLEYKNIYILHFWKQRLSYHIVEKKNYTFLQGRKWPSQFIAAIGSWEWRWHLKILQTYKNEFCVFGKHWGEFVGGKSCNNWGGWTLKASKEMHHQICRYFLKLKVYRLKKINILFTLT